MTLHDFVVLYTREHANTRKQLHAFPADKFQFKPHERSNSAHQLGWTFVVEEALMLKALTNEPVLGGGFPPAPATWTEVLDAFDAGHVKVLAAAGLGRRGRAESGDLLRRAETDRRLPAGGLPLVHPERPDPPPRTVVGLRAHGRREGAVDLRADRG